MGLECRGAHGVSKTRWWIGLAFRCHGEERSDETIQPVDKLTTPGAVEGLESRWIAAPAEPGSQ